MRPNFQPKLDLPRVIGGDVVKLEAGPPSIWRGTTVLGGDGAAFGGQMAAQALMVAQAHEPGRPPESIHTHFLAAAQPCAPINHRVELLRSGRSFSVLRVDTWQGERQCLTSIITLHDDETSPEHQAPMASLGRPETYPISHFIPPGTDAAVRRCFEIREAKSDAKITDGGHPRQGYWFRYEGSLGEQQAAHNAALVWFADLSMPWTTDLPYDESHGRRVGASLDHTLWFHRPLRADAWLYFEQESLVYAGARALTRGVFFSEDGALVASAAQETLLRRIL